MSNVVTISDKKDLFSPEQVELLKRQIAPDLTDDELSIFLYQCKRNGLDPFARQIHAVKRQGKLTIQTAIDGFRLIAFRTNAYAGKDEAVFTYEGNRLIRCKLTVYKLVNGEKCAFTATARWDEYYPGEKQGFMWKKMPETMLEKCCEAKALRMAFPAELSGIYSNDEMAQADGPIQAQPVQEKQVEAIPEAKTVSHPKRQVDHERLYCEYCGANLKRSSKSPDMWYCPNFNDKKKHVRPVKEDRLLEYMDYLEMREKEKEKEMGLDCPKFEDS